MMNVYQEQPNVNNPHSSHNITEQKPLIQDEQIPLSSSLYFILQIFIILEDSKPIWSWRLPVAIIMLFGAVICWITMAELIQYLQTKSGKKYDKVYFYYSKFKLSKAILYCIYNSWILFYFPYCVWLLEDFKLLYV